MKGMWLLFVITQLLHVVKTARILGVFAHPIRSNSLYTHAVMEAIAAAGHNVTVYSHFKPSSGSSFQHVYIPPEFGANLSYEDFIRTFSKHGFGGSALRIISHYKSEMFLSHRTVQKLLYSNETFDLVFTSAAFGEESLLVFGYVFSAPTISLMPSGTWSAIDYIAGNSLSLAYAPEYSVFPFTDKMSFVERVQNVLSGAASVLLYYWYDLPRHDAILQRHAALLSPPPPPVHQMVRDVALTFVNVRPSVSYPKPLTPNIVMIGGIHINSNTPPLSKEIQQLMDNAKEGVIFCSLGSIVPVDTMPRHILQAYINAFKQLPHKVIWKIAVTAMPDLPDNIMVSSWLPQQQILEHPNLKLFLTHGGLSSQLETLRAGVPVVGIPFFTDQPHNIRMYEHLGVGVGLSLQNLTEHTITAALKTVLNNASYAENARRVARIYADQPMKPADLVVYWTEYVLRHGAAHLRPQAAMMAWYQRCLLDVAAFILVTIVSIIVIGAKTASIVHRLINSRFTVKLKSS